MFHIVTDTSANLPWDYTAAHGVTVVPLSYEMRGAEHLEQAGGRFNGAAYYGAMRSGILATTSQVPPQRFVDAFRPLLEQGGDILYISMSSGISGSFQSANMAAAELREEFPERQITLVDTLAASLGEGLQVMEAVRSRDYGLTLEATANNLLNRRRNLCQLLMVDDLNFLKRTGRVSGAAAFVGSMLGVKPLLKGSPDGQLVLSAKIRGRKHAIRAMADRYAELARSTHLQTVGIAHADCPEDAEELAKLLRAAAKPYDILTVCYEPVTGAHTGPDALALFFWGDDDVRSKY